MKNEKWFASDRITDSDFIKICKESESMSQAAAKLRMHFNTFKRLAIKLDCYNPNQSGKGMKKKHNGNKIELDDIILNNKYPQYQTYKLKLRLLNEGILENKCDICGITEWLNTKLNMELDHIDGNRTNHNITNLRMLCPNCHAQTPTYRAKNKIEPHD